jgi:hypothetical protein
MSNIYTLFKDLLPKYPLMVGQVTAIDNGVATITLQDGKIMQARGTATVGDNVFFRDGVIEGPAPSLTLEVIDV